MEKGTHRSKGLPKKDLWPVNVEAAEADGLKSRRGQQNKQAVPLNPPRCTLSRRLKSHPVLRRASGRRMQDNSGHMISDQIHSVPFNFIFVFLFTVGRKPEPDPPKWATLSGKTLFSQEQTSLVWGTLLL